MASERSNTLLRTLDRRLGIPLVAMLGAARALHRRRRPESVRRVGLLKTAGIGDVVLLSAVARDIAALEGVELYVFTGRANAAAARLIPGTTAVVELPITRPHQAVALMRRHPLDVLLDFGPWPRINALLSATSRARFTVGFRTPGQWRHFAYDLVVDHSRDVHEVDNYRRLAAAAGFQVGAAPALGHGQPVPRALLPMRPFVVCHLWSAGFKGALKEWAPRHWRAVIESLVAGGHDVVLTGGPDDRDATAAFLRDLNAASARVHDLSGKLELSQTLELLRRSELVISVNTGVMHMAAAVGAPVISLEGPTPVRRWGPIGEQVTSIVSTHPAAGYLHLGWEDGPGSPETMEAISPDAVLRAARTVLGDEPQGAGRPARVRGRDHGRVHRVGSAGELRDREGADPSTLAS